MSRSPTPENIAFLEGYNALFHENETKELVYNPHEFGPIHDHWDAGYQAALDEYTAKSREAQRNAK